MKPLTKYSALVYFDHFNDDRSVYLADEADAVIADLNGHAEVWSAVAAVRAKRIAELEAERDAARADAERYRWLRDSLGSKVSHWFCTEGGEELDAAIDAARGAA